VPADVFAAGNVMRVSITGLREAQQRLIRANDALSPRGTEGTMRLAVGAVHRYLMGLKRDTPPRGAQGILPVITGRLANSMFMRVQVQSGGVTGIVATNVDYAVSVERRRQFMARTARAMQRPVQQLFQQHVRMVVSRG
jgi:hypothetical protein